MIRSSTRHYLTRWGCIPRHAVGINILSGSFMPTFILPCCGRDDSQVYGGIRAARRAAAGQHSLSLQQRCCGEPKRGFSLEVHIVVRHFQGLALDFQSRTCTSTLCQRRATAAQHLKFEIAGDQVLQRECWKAVTVVVCYANLTIPPSFLDKASLACLECDLR